MEVSSERQGRGYGKKADKTLGQGVTERFGVQPITIDGMLG